MQPISIYIHWPFCLSLCPYCDFNSHIAEAIDQTAWLQAYNTEIDYFAGQIKGKSVRSIFFGGGTPSLMQPKIVAGLLQKIASVAEISRFTEITLEANPTSYETQKFKEFKAAGINRVSIGVQSLKQEGLEILGRKHSSKEAILAIESASKIFDRYSFDLIYATPNQTLANWQKELKSALSLARGGHISLYQLTIEKGTPFYRLFKDGKLSLPSNEAAAYMYEWTNEYLQTQNYRRYEISNYAQQDQECIHNLCYWNYGEYIGIGPGAHSRLHYRDHVESMMMIHNPKKWLQSVATRGHGIQTRNQLSERELIEEVLMMGTRLSRGLSKEKFQQITKRSLNEILNMQTTKQYIEQGFVEMQDKYLVLTDKGLMLHNYLIPRMLL